jgi:hypothetical protein
MADEREAILSEWETALSDVSDCKVASRDFGLVLAVQLDEFPAAFVLDLGDTVDEPEILQRNNLTTMQIGVVTVLRGSTAATTASEHSAFQRKILRAIYEAVASSDDVTGFARTGRSQLAFDTRFGPNVVYQGMQFDVQFIEDIVELLNE